MPLILFNFEIHSNRSLMLNFWSRGNDSDNNNARNIVRRTPQTTLSWILAERNCGI